MTPLFVRTFPQSALPDYLRINIRILRKMGSAHGRAYLWKAAYNPHVEKADG